MALVSNYTHGHHQSVLKSHRWRTIENSAAHLAPRLTPDAELLDIGCGPGTLTCDLAERVRRVTAVEHTAEALDLCRVEAERRGVTNIDFVVADVHDLTFDDASFDIVHAHQVLQHVADPVRALTQMRRVCRPGGTVSVRESDYHGFVWYPESQALNRWMDLYQRVARSNGGEPDAGRMLLAWAHEVGFADVTYTSSTWCHASPAERDHWGGMWAERVLSSKLGEQAVAEGFADRAELEEISAAWLEWAANPDATISVLHGEILGTV